MESQAKQVENVNTFRTLSHHGFQTVTQKHTDLSSIPHVACFTSTRQAIKQTFDNQTYTIPCNAWVSMLGAWLCSACCCVPGPLNALVLTWIHNFYVCFRYPKPAKLACKQTCKEENNQTSKAPLAGPLFFVLCLISFFIGWLVFVVCFVVCFWHQFVKLQAALWCCSFRRRCSLTACPFSQLRGICNYNTVYLQPGSVCWHLPCASDSHHTLHSCMHHPQSPGCMALFTWHLTLLACRQHVQRRARRRAALQASHSSLWATRGQWWSTHH
jgi:hypothetical protein